MTRAEVLAITVATGNDDLWPHRYQITLTFTVPADSEIEAAAWALSLLEEQQ